MTPVQFKNISLFKTDEDIVLGYHNQTLEVAQVSEALWQDLSLGPSTSEGLSELMLWSESRGHSSPSARPVSKIRTLTINSTQLCNLRCHYCAAGGDGSYGAPVVKFDLAQGLPQLEWLMARCPSGERFQINFLGGEPLLFPEVVQDIAEKALELGHKFGLAVHFALITNGTRFSEPGVTELLNQFKMVVTVSIDGPPQVQDRVRVKPNGKGSSGDIENGLEILFKNRNRIGAIGVSSVFHQQHWKVTETYQYLSQWDFDFYDFNYSHTDFCVESSLAFCQEMGELALQATEKGGEAELRKIRAFDNIFQRLDSQVPLENYCGSGKSLLSMDAKGDLFACPWEINEPHLKLNNDSGINEAALSPYLEDQVLKQPCQSCWARALCGGGCTYSHTQATGSRKKVDGVFCLRIQGLIKTALIYYEKYRRAL